MSQVERIAAGLPVGTIVANERRAFIKNELDLGLGQENWSSTAGQTFTDYEIDEYLGDRLFINFDGKAAVVRHGKKNPEQP